MRYVWPVSEIHEPGWVGHAVWWLVYPLGFVGAYPEGESGPPAPGEHRLARLLPWLNYVKRHGATGIALGPVFESETHGYDTVNHFKIDPRLGDDSDFDALVAEAHRLGLHVQLDGVFNKVARTHPRALEALAGGPDSRAMEWFKSWRYDDESELSDADGTENSLIELNHNSPAVQDYVVDVLSYWLDRGVDSWRLDSAYKVPTTFWASVLARVRESHPDAYFVAEVINGDYASFAKAATVDSVTQYELWKAIWSSLDSQNLFELEWAVLRHNALLESFVPLTFIGNHDTSRIASMIGDPRHLPHAVALLATLGGTPTIYAGDPHMAKALKEDGPGGSVAVRPEFPVNPNDMPDDADVFEFFETYKQLVGLRKRNPWLHRAHVEPLLVENKHVALRLRPHDAAPGDTRAIRLLLNLSDQPIPKPVNLPPDNFLHCDPQTAETGILAPHGWAIAAGP